MNTFEQFLKSTINGSEVLTEDRVQELIDSTGEAAYHELYAYAYRIAGFVSVYVRRSAPVDLDEGDWQDAVQECMIQFPKILGSYSRSDAPFLKYAGSAFQNVIKDYLWTLAKGGTGSGRSGASTLNSSNDEIRIPGSIDEDNDEDADSSYGLENYTESTSHGTRDPMEELISEETIRALMVAAAFKPKRRGPNPEGRPPSKSEARKLNPLRMHKARARSCVRGNGATV